MSRRTFARATVAGVSVALVATLAACGGSADGATDAADGATEPGSAPDTLTLGSWAAIPPETLERFTAETGIEVQVQRFGTAGDALSAIRSGLIADGAGLPDVQFLELDWMTELLATPDDWATLPPVEGRWLDWKVEQGSVDGEIKGYGTDIGPMAIAFSSQMMADAGLPSDPDAFVEFVGGVDGTWEDFLEAGRQFTQASGGTAWVNSMTTVAQAAINQLPAAYENPETGNPFEMADNTAVRDIFMMMSEGITDGLSAGIGPWGEEFPAGIQNRSFATLVFPAWFAGRFQESAGDVDDWRIATVFPDGGGNWGGSFAAVPATGDNIYWATQLADFLTSPESALELFIYGGPFPSQVEVFEDEALTSVTNPLLGDQHLGQIFAELAERTDIEAVTGFRGMNFSGIHDMLAQAIGRVQDGAETPEQAWGSLVSQFESMGFTTD